MAFHSEIAWLLISVLNAGFSWHVALSPIPTNEARVWVALVFAVTAAFDFGTAQIRWTRLPSFNLSLQSKSAACIVALEWLKTNWISTGIIFLMTVAGIASTLAAARIVKEVRRLQYKHGVLDGMERGEGQRCKVCSGRGFTSTTQLSVDEKAVLSSNEDMQLADTLAKL
ncbi:hypothetical protein CYLTODRAFT_424912 [Cylindrobasidium torrendii FP15055 ss-10]|uniref:Uncharacterized protein n=1 Tax=Cylindrobasidium torrendii FP15055 ss-10 TaxID=1314674 RepID=A0A0D7B2E6_9AGAR|nr:hypothetical protein CYLTODRAFT_424912 [Cylindrobasidium torrendii FP15055 ss-10]